MTAKKQTRVPLSSFDDLDASGIGAGYTPYAMPVEETPAAAPQEGSGLIRRIAGDGILTAVKGAIGVPEAAVGLTDIATGGSVGKFLENEGGSVGFRPKQAKEYLDQFYSPEQKAAFAAVQGAANPEDGLGRRIVDTGMAALRNPSVVAHAVGESVPMIGAGGVLGRGVMAMAPKFSGFAAAGIGEGIMAAGSGAEQIRQQTADGYLTGTQSLLAAGSGMATGALGIIAGKAAKTLGIGDIDTLIVGGKHVDPALQKGFTRKLLEGAFTEGVLEELPQSVQEQVVQNYALGKPLDEGVDQAVVMGLLSGGAMGMGAQVLGGSPKVPEVGPMSRAANLAGAPVVPPAVPTPVVAPVVPAVQPTAVEAAPAPFDAAAAQAEYRARTLAMEAQEEERARLDAATDPIPLEEASQEDQAAYLQGPATDELSADDLFPAPAATVSGDILNTNGVPFKTLPGAIAAQKKAGDTHEVVPVASGFVVRAKEDTNGATATPAGLDQGADEPASNQPGGSGIVALAEPIDEQRGNVQGDAEPVAGNGPADAVPLPGTGPAAVEKPQNQPQYLEPLAQVATESVATAAPEIGTSANLPPAPSAEMPSEEGDQWTRMPQADRLALTTRTGMAKMVADKIARQPWADITPKTRARIVGAMTAAAPVTQPAQPVMGEGAGGSQPTQVATNQPAPAVAQGDGINDSIRALRAKSFKTAKQSGPRGDVRLNTGGEFVSFDDAVAEARKAIANGVRAVPFQIHDALDVNLGETDRIIAELNETAPTPASLQEASADNFQLSQSAEDSLAGQGSVFDVPAESEAQAATPGQPDAVNQATGDFGPILTQYRHDAQGAIKALTELQDGEAVAALQHHEVGDIDLVWGKPPAGKQEGFGLAKISIKHPEVLDDLQGFLNGLHKDKPNSGANRIRLVNDAGDAVVSLDWKGEQKVWLLTAYKKGAEAGTTMDTASNGLKDDTARLEPGPEQTLPQPTAEGKPAKIEDSGEVLEGARKLYAKNYAAKLDEGTGMDTAAVPLSKSWPEPDYQRLIDEGADPWAVAMARAMRDEVPTKPSSSWKLKGWVQKVEALRDMTAKVMSGEMTKEKFKTTGGQFNLADWFNKIDLYEAVGHANSLKGLTFGRHEYGMYAGQTFNPAKVLWTINMPSKSASATWSNGNWGNDLAVADTKAEAIEKFKAWSAAQVEAPPVAAKATSFDIYSYRSKPNVFIVGKRISSAKSVDLKEFPTAKEARAYVAANQAELERLLAEAKFEPSERGESNAPRVGADHRNGADVTTDQFRDTFGFRGEQFGASMPQGERQANMNQAYDALMDLAGVVGIPPKALSLNGELGLAFGARGVGGKNPAAAHYERDTTGAVTPNRVVINLTRKNGAGSLAHEWFHAVDNYFARMRGEKAGMLTESYANRGEGVRPEMVTAFKQLMTTIQLSGMRERSKQLDKKRVKDYWSTGLEMAARSFESYVIAKLQDKNGSNDYLANIVPEELYAMQGSYPYPVMGEMPAIRAAFDNFFDVVQTKETEQGVAMFSRSTSDTTGQNKAQVTAIVSAIKARWGNAPEIVVADNMADPLIPQAVRDYDQTQRDQYDLNRALNIAKRRSISDEEQLQIAFIDPDSTSNLGARQATLNEIGNLLKTPVNHGTLGATSDAIDGNTPSVKGRVDGSRSNIQRLRDLLNGQTFAEQPFSSLDVKTQGLVLADVFRLTQDSKVLDSVIKLIPVDVMNVITGGKLSTEMLFNNESVFRDRLAVISGVTVSGQVVTDTLVRAAALSSAVIVDVNNIPTLALKRSPTTDALQSNNSHKNSNMYRESSRESIGNARGFVYKGKVYLIASELQTPNDVVETLFHEALGHMGLRGVFGDKLKPILQQLAGLRRADVSAKAEQYGLDMAVEADRLQAAEEVLAELAQTKPELGYVKRAIAVIRSWLREHVPGFTGMKMSDAELVQNFILPARRFIERRGGPGAFTAAVEKPQNQSQDLEPLAQVATESVATAAPEIGTSAKNAADAAPDVLFSRSPIGQAVQSTQDALKNATVTDLLKQFGNRLSDFRGLGLQALGRRQLVDIYGKDLPAMVAYSDMVAQMDADKNESGAEADGLATDWGKLTDERQLAELMHDATLAQIDPDKPMVDGDDDNQYEALKDGFDILSLDAKAAFRKARDMYSTHNEKVRQAIQERIMRSDLSSAKKAALLERMDGEFFQKVKGVYFPLARFGQYVTVVKDAGGNVVSANRSETMNEAVATRKVLQKQFPLSGGFRVGKVLKDREFNAARDGVGRGFMADLFETLEKTGAGDELMDSISQLYLAALPDLSWAKHGIHRKGTPGFSQDARRAFAQNMFHGARYLAKLRYADQLQSGLDAMQEHIAKQSENESYDSVKAQQVVDEMVKRHESMMNPDSSPLSTALTSLGFVFHLGLSPASALVNLSQTALVAYPVMGAKWGFGKASAALLVASKQAASNKNDISSTLNEDERRAYDEAVRRGVIDVTMAHDLAGIAQGEDAKVSSALKPVMKYASFLFHHAEKFNRQVTFVAAYRLAREAGTAHDKSFDEAVKATYDGHFDYSASNRPRLMQGNVARVVFLFKQYSQNMIYTLTRNAQQAIKAETPEGRAEARKALSGLLVSHAMAAGVFGLPVVGMLFSAASLIGGDDDEPWDAKVALQNMLADSMGPKAAEVFAHGLSRLTPWDISGRVGLDKLLLPDVQEGLEGTRAAESWLAQAVGPVAGIGINMAKGLSEMGKGEYQRGLESMLPTALRGPVKAWRYSTEGNVDKSGVAINDEVSTAGVWGQALGFSPSETRLAQEGKSAIYSADKAIQTRRSNLVRQFSLASMAKDVEGQADARKAIVGFNKKNPKAAISQTNLVSSIKARQKRINQARMGVYLPGKRQDAMEAGRFAEVE